MTTLLVILSHSGYNGLVARHWPFFLKAQCDILGVGRENTKCEWPTERLIGTVNIGLESYASGDNHIVRLLNAIEHCLTTESLKTYGAFCLIEPDAIFFKPVPEIKPGQFVTKLVGGGSPGFFGSKYFHTPWQMDRIVAGRMLRYGTRMLKAGLIEQGFIDRFLGLMVDLYDIEVTEAQTYSQNSLDTPEKIADAGRAVKAGAWYVHGVKTAEQLRQLSHASA